MTTSPTSSTSAPPLRLRYSAVSDVGRHRKENQDSGYAGDHLLVVADGVGGAAYGDVASSTAVHVLRRLDRDDNGEMLTALAGAVHRVHDRLAEMVEEDPELEGTSTTVTAALFDGSSLGFVHVGDSRAYLLHEGRVSQLTKDHTFVQTLVDEGQISERDSRSHPHRNIILRAVDATQETDPDLFHVEPQAGDRVLVCSDGCSGSLEDAQIAAILGDGTVDYAALTLVEAALSHGSTDNVTVVVAEVVDASIVDDPESTAAAAIGPMLVGAASQQPRRGSLLTVGHAGRDPRDTGELDPVAEEPLDPEELRYAPQPPRRRGWFRRLLLILIPVVVLAAALSGGYAWSQQQFYVAMDGDEVAIYRGVQLDLPGISLSHPYDRIEGLPVAALPVFDRGRVADGIAASDLDDARRIVERLQARAVCPTEDQPPTPSPNASPDGRGSSDPTPGRSGPTTDPSANPSGRPAPRAAGDAAEGASGEPGATSIVGDPALAEACAEEASP